MNMPVKDIRRPNAGFWILLVILISAVSVLSILVGPMSTPPSWVLLELRLPRIVLALLAGSALAVSGCILQSILRNDLATPYTLGISAGAGLVAGTVILIGLVVPPVILIGTGTAGALIAVACVYAISAFSKHGRSASGILLAGVTMNLIGAALLLMFEYFSSASRLIEIVRWMMGDLSVIGWSKPLFLLPFVLAGVLFAWVRSGVLNQIAQGEDIAASRGVAVTRETNILLVTAALLAGATVGVIGPVGFVGLIVPHIMRRFTGSDYRYLLPASVFGGMFLVLLADLISRIVISPAELPIGIVMSLLGGPFFLFLLIRRN